MSYPNAAISFPGLFGDWKFTLSPKLLDVGNGVYWYGVLIGAALLIALWFCMKQAHKYGLTEDNVFDTVLWAIPFSIIGARLYYVIFYLDLYRTEDGGLDFLKMLRIWDGGIAIYGAIIGAFLSAFIVCRIKKLNFWAFTDCGVMGLFLGQAIGRWGNFFNREAFGSMTNLPWRMRLWLSESYYIDVHPTFLYESLWNLLGLALLFFFFSRRRRFDGQNTCFYFLWYGIGRFFIEGLRTDSLYLFDWELFGMRIRVSQALSLVMILITVVILFLKRKSDPAKLAVNCYAATEDSCSAETAAAASDCIPAPESDASVVSDAESCAKMEDSPSGEENCQ